MKKAVLLINLGTPASTKAKDIRRYLREFLTDEQVIDLPWLPRYLLVNFIIVPFRFRKTQALYKKIWENGSPLLLLSEKTALKLQNQLKQPVYLAMRYQQPSIKNVLIKMQQDHIEDLTILPMYPHYALSSYETAREELKRQAKKISFTASLRFVDPVFQHPQYIAALSEKIKQFGPESYQRILFSYHSIPNRHISKIPACSNHCFQDVNCCQVAKGEILQRCYRAQCLVTTKLVTEKLQLTGEVKSCFQSRLTREPWLTPSLEAELELAKQEGVTSLMVVAPSFLTDCLETLEEIDIRGRAQFCENQPLRKFTYVPCLNDDDAWMLHCAAILDLPGV